MTPETFLKVSEIHHVGGFTKYWSRCRTTFKSRGLGMRAAFQLWKALRQEYYHELSCQPNLYTISRR